LNELVQRHDAQSHWVETVVLAESLEIVWVTSGQRTLEISDPIASVFCILGSLISGRNPKRLALV
jgi:hypothetical protein